MKVKRGVFILWKEETKHMVPQNLIRPNVVMQCEKGYDSRIDIFMYKCQSIMMVFYFILN